MNITVACVRGLYVVTTHNYNVCRLAQLRILEILVSDVRSIQVFDRAIESRQLQIRGFPRLPCYADSSVDAIRHMDPVFHIPSALVAN